MYWVGSVVGGAEGVGCVEFWSAFEILVMSYARIFYFIYYLGIGLAEGSILVSWGFNSIIVFERLARGL
jgi:hypothetical protein